MQPLSALEAQAVEYVLTPSAKSLTKSTTTSFRGSIFVFNLYKRSTKPAPRISNPHVPFRKRLLLNGDPLLLLCISHLD